MAPFTRFIILQVDDPPGAEIIHTHLGEVPTLGGVLPLPGLLVILVME